ncbi:SRPBCC family protein [Natronococcus wangiae]|uniref:hypothetical protein n=1 Tax=Natronococcus wangiae TaxID=3068275 RepID=UPI00273DB4DA|nr:hypothetical protein [Natronococcus sp. AD5]
MVREITNSGDRQFEWITEWELNTPIEAVWTELIANIDQYPQWRENYTKERSDESGWTPTPGETIDLELTRFFPGLFHLLLKLPKSTNITQSSSSQQMK